MKQEGVTLQKDLNLKDQIYPDMGSDGEDNSIASSAALGALLEAGAPGADAETRVKRLAERLARLDAQNVAGMLAAASEGGGAGARLAERLDAGLAAGAGLAARLRRCEAVVRAAPDAAHARSGAARADANARALLSELEDLYQWLDAAPLRDLDSLSEVSLATAEGRARALAAGGALRAALRAERGAAPARLRLAAARERLRRLARARDALAQALARHLNNALIHLANEASPERRKHHAELLPYAPFMRWLKDMDERAFDGLAKVYSGTWARVYERSLHGALEAARAALAAAPPDRADPILDNVYSGTWARVYERSLHGALEAARAALAAAPPDRADPILDNVYSGTWARVYERSLHGALEAARAALAAAPPDRADPILDNVYSGTWARVYERSLHGALEAARAALAAAPPDRADPILDNVLTLIESLCDAEQDFCTQFFYLDIDVKSDGSDGERSERSEGGERARAGAETRRFMTELFPGLEAELVALVGHVEKVDKYGAMRALACLGRRVVGGAEAGGAGGAGGAGEARWARAALAGGAVAAKRQADRAVAARLAALPDAVKHAARRPKCGLLSFIRDFEELSGACEAIFAGGRRADLDRWYVSLGAALLRAIHHADHPRTPRAVLHMENYHRLHGVVSSLRAPALEALRRECRARYSDALRAYVTQYFGRPLEKLTQFFEGVAEAVAGGVREDEVCYRAAFSKHELRRLLAMYPAPEVRKSLHRLYRMVEKHLSEEGGLLQVVWRAMQEEFISQHRALQSRIATCYPGAGLSMPLTTQDILDAFSDIAREH